MDYGLWIDWQSFYAAINRRLFRADRLIYLDN